MTKHVIKRFAGGVWGLDSIAGFVYKAYAWRGEQERGRHVLR